MLRRPKSCLWPDMIKLVDDRPIAVAFQQRQIFIKVHAVEARRHLDRGAVALLVNADDLESGIMIGQAAFAAAQLIDEVLQRQPFDLTPKVSDDTGAWVEDITHQAFIGIGHGMHIVRHGLGNGLRHRIVLP